MGSPDVILTPFDRKFDEKKNEITPGIYRPHIFEIIKIGELTADTKTQKLS